MSTKNLIILLLMHCCIITNAQLFKISETKLHKALAQINKTKSEIENGTRSNHTLFLNVSMLEICEDLSNALKNPNACCIGKNGHYCGPAVILNWYINNHPDKYVNTVISLADKGYASEPEFKRKLKTPRYLKKRVNFEIIDTIDNRVIREDIDSTSLSDFILGSALVYAEKGIQRVGLISKKAIYRKSSIASFVYTNTMPWEVDDYFRRLGININQQAYYWGKKNRIETLKMIDNSVLNGKMPIIFDNHYISFVQTKNFLYRTTGAHFITLHRFHLNLEKQYRRFFLLGLWRSERKSSPDL